jgi:colanic acid/amylovoran biosynthesis glycosyltransferase
MTIRRVGYILNIFPKLSETFIAEELAELRRRNIEVRILALQPPRDEPRHQLIKDAELDRLTSYDPHRFLTEMRQFKPDLVHAHFAREATAKAREVAGELGVGYTFTAHGYDIHRKPPADFFERAMAARGVVTVSEANAAYIQNTFKVPKSRVRVIPCGVDIQRFHPAPSGAPDEPVPIILCVARHVAVKNLSLLLRACALLKQRGCHYRCIMVGDGPLRTELVAERARLDLAGVVEMPGALTQIEVANLWRRSTVGVLTSDNEGMPVALMEAAASGVPVVATKVGGVPELVQEGLTGLLCAAGDPEAFANAISSILSDAPARQSMARAARRRAEQCFSVTAQGDALLEFWSKVCNGGSA